MSDDADRADARIEAVVTDAIAAARRYPSLPYTGHCHWCGEDIAPTLAADAAALPPEGACVALGRPGADATGGGRRFCDADCRDAWERDHARRR